MSGTKAERRDEKKLMTITRANKRHIKFEIKCLRYKLKKLWRKRSMEYDMYSRAAWDDWRYRTVTAEQQSQWQNDSETLRNAKTKGELATLLLHPKSEIRQIAMTRCLEIECQDQIKVLQAKITYGE